MKAARLHAFHKPLVLEDLPAPVPQGDQVLIRVSGCGVCHSDLHVIDGDLPPELVRFPITMGHEITGRVERLGPDAQGLTEGEPVAVFVGWGCGWCSTCVSGHEQICPRGEEAGSTRDGGFAEYLLVPHRRHLVPLGDLDPLEATPLGCAGISSYAGVKRVRPYLQGGSSLVVLGIGALGSYAVQIARAITGARIIAISRTREELDRAVTMGADETVLFGDSALKQVLELTAGEGAEAVLDFVGKDETLALAARMVKRSGILALLGLFGGTVPFGFYAAAPEVVFTTVYAGTRTDLDEVVALARSRRIRLLPITSYPLDQANAALEDLRGGRITYRAVLEPR